LTARPLIVVADDDDAVRKVWTLALTRAGYRTIESRTGRGAVDFMGTLQPDLLILDLHMPDLSGDDVLAHLREAPVLRQIPVLIVSGFLADKAAGAELGLNIVGRLQKPQLPTALLEAVRTALAGRPA
jgi:CheY-like chemotaxis protein